jgi:hypothetical protein
MSVPTASFSFIPLCLDLEMHHHMGRRPSGLRVARRLSQETTHMPFDTELFIAGPIEGPTHFSQFVPLLVDGWGTDFLERGCLSAHYRNACTEGDRVRAFVAPPLSAGDRCVRIWAEKADGAPVLTGTAKIGPDHEASELDGRMARLRPPERLLDHATLKESYAGYRDGREK